MELSVLLDGDNIYKFPTVPKRLLKRNAFEYIIIINKNFTTDSRSGSVLIYNLYNK